MITTTYFNKILKHFVLKKVWYDYYYVGGISLRLCENFDDAEWEDQYFYNMRDDEHHLCLRLSKCQLIRELYED